MVPWLAAAPLPHAPRRSWGTRNDPLAMQPPPAVAEWGPQEEVAAGKACENSSKKDTPVGGMHWRDARATSVRARWRASRATSPAIQRAPAVAERGGEEEVVGVCDSVPH